MPTLVILLVGLFIWASPARADDARLAAIEARLRAQPAVAAPSLQALANALPAGSAARTEALFLRGALLVQLGEPEAVERAAAELAASAQAGSTGAPLPQADAQALAQAAAQTLRALWLSRHGSLGAADRLLADALAELATPPPPGLQLRMLAVQGRIKELRGQLDAAVALHQQAVLLADTLGPAWRRAEHRSALSYALMHAQQLPAARAVDAEALALARQAGDALTLSKVLTTHAILLGATNEPATELQALQGAISHARAAGARQEELLGLANLADFYLKHGDYATALRLSNEALPLARAVRNPIIESVALTNAGLAKISLRQRDAGLALVREALLLEERAGGITAMAQIHREAGVYLERAGYLPEAWASFVEHRRLTDEVFRREHQQALLETQAAFEHERRQRDLALLATEKGLGEARLQTRTLHQRLWAVGTLAGVLMLALVAVLLRRLWRSNIALRHSTRQLQAANETDALTGLFNRRHLQRLLAPAGPAAAGFEGALLLIDVDHFKRINDAHGHAAGDAVLQAVARRLRGALREDDVLVRWGGEEFLALVRGQTAGQLEALAERLLHALGTEPVEHAGRALRVTASIGFASFPLPPERAPVHWERAVDLADAAMYLAKAHGRNCAWGVRSLRPDSSLGLGPLGDTLEAAWHAGRADISQHPGPAAPPAQGTAAPGQRVAATLALSLALLLPLAMHGSPTQAASAPLAGLAALQARAASAVDEGYDRPVQALNKLAYWQTGTAPGSEGWRVLETARGLVLARAGRHEEAAEVATALRHTGPPPLAAADAALVQAVSLDIAGQAQRSRERSQQALAMYQALCAQRQPALRGCDYRHNLRAQLMLARQLLMQGQASRARDEAQAAAALAREKADSDYQASASALAARASDMLGEREQASQQFDHALRLARLAGGPALRARMALAETVHRETRGDTAGARRAAEQGLPWARQAQSPRLEALLLANLSDSYLRAGQHRQALQAVARALPVVRAHGDQRAERVLLVNASLARIGLGELAAARVTLEELHAAFRDAGASADQAELLREFSDALAAAGDLRGALDLHHREREVAAAVMAANREAALAELRQRFDREAQQRRLDQLTRDNALIAAQLDNRSARQRLWAAAAAVLVLAVLLTGAAYGHVRRLNRRLAHNHDSLRQQSQHDALTGLANRRAVAARLPGTCQGALLLVDIDHFKRINDTHGHAGGDAVLQAVAQRLQACVREGDLVARWGGEEFLIHAPGLDADAAAALAQRVLQAIGSQPVAWAGTPVAVTVSVGHGSFPLPQAPGAMPLERAVNLADMALYAAKNQGRNCSASVAQALLQGSWPGPAGAPMQQPALVG